MGKRSVLKVLHLVISLNTGGLERFVIDLVKGNSSDIEQVVVCLEAEGDLAKFCQCEVIQLNMLPGIKVSVIKSINEIIKQYRIDIIHSHNEKAQFYGSIAGLLNRIPVVHTKHGKNIVKLKPLLRNNLVARFCKKIVAVSRDAALECVRDERISAKKVLTIQNGVDCDHFCPSVRPSKIREELGLGEEAFVIGIVARLAHVKNHKSLLEACQILYDKGRDFTLLVVGDGVLRGDLEDYALNLGIADCVKFLGMRQDIVDLMRAMDLFVLSSLSEGVSITLLEAMACGLPIVATEVGGNPEVVVDSVTGYLVPPEDPSQLAEKISYVLSNDDLRVRFSQAARKRVVENFSLSNVIDQYKNLYNEVAILS